MPWTLPSYTSNRQSIPVSQNTSLPPNGKTAGGKKDTSIKVTVVLEEHNMIERMKGYVSTLNRKLIQELATVNEAPCLSLYMPTHNYPAYNPQDAIMYQHLVKQLEFALLRQYSVTETLSILRPFEKLKRDSEFWNCRGQGVAVFVSVGFTRYVSLQLSVVENVLIGSQFDLAPLRQYSFMQVS
ncbi:MAG: hypothetical protein RIG68_25755 [Imperialibacter sp.]|uniref:hypothetical protein n=1 Tax=Imperialibacter sp. TaxID=2038411 RepID=UPI0032EAB95E